MNDALKPLRAVIPPVGEGRIHHGHAHPEHTRHGHHHHESGQAEHKNAGHGHDEHGHGDGRGLPAARMGSPRFSLLALSGMQRLMLIIAPLVTLWLLTLWAIRHG